MIERYGRFSCSESRQIASEWTDLETLEPEVRWRGTDRSVVYALFSKVGFTTALREDATRRDDIHLFTVDDVLELF